MNIAEDYLAFQQELTRTFLAEALEHLELIEEQLNEWKCSHSKEAINDVFRRVHSIKGASGAVNFSEFSESIHVFEDVLKKIADQSIPFTEKLVEDIYRCFDCLSDAVHELDQTGESSSDRKIPTIIKSYLEGGTQIDESQAEESDAPHQKNSDNQRVIDEDDQSSLNEKLAVFDRPPRVLLCEDDTAFITMIRRVLEKEGLDIKTASSAEEGLEIFAKEKIDFVITDYKMAELTGIDMLKAIRSKNSTIPVMIMSGQAGINELAKEMLDFDACYYLEKPVSVNVLRLGVKQAIKFYFTQKALQDVVTDNFRVFLGCRKLAFQNLPAEEKMAIEKDVEKSMNHFIGLIERLKKVLSWTV